ncbi:Stk1 family PASTA domain-containing Ser/Thr kinase [Leifsonia kafniensis]|uniref:non-specific serine/threonine protein kinase n=1 Tax=Leifsonia kafniensis TaxID=475957 RepID=A0ABP7KRE4_9MICO
MTQRPGSAAGHEGDSPSGASLISDRFLLGELLGSGGSASVFAATDVTTGGGVALKVLHPRLSDASATQQAFFRQARVASAIRHPNVAGVVALGTDQNQSPPVVWIALERAGGVSLAERVEQRGPLDSADAVAVAEGMLRGVAAAHAVGVIHRDLSPGNIMVPLESAIASESVRVIDFGLADAAGRPVLGIDVVRTAQPSSAETPPPAELGVLGTVHYLSPEQASGAAVDERSDLYQLSAVLFFALTGQPPYPRESAEATILAHLHAPPPVPSSVRSGISRELDRLVVKGMLTAQQSRFVSAEEMLAAVLSIPGQRTQQQSQQQHAPSAARTVAATRVLPNPSTALTKVLRAQPSSRRRPGAVSATSAGRQRPRPLRAAWLAGISVAVLAVVIGGFIAASGSTLAPAVVASPSSHPSEPAAPPSSAPPPETVTVTAVEMPSVVQLSLDAARSALAHAGLTVGSVGVEDSAEPEGTVIAASRSAGERAEAGWSVDLVAASGWNLVPSVVGLTAAEASAALAAAGFAVTVVNGGSTSAGGENVLSADPGVGTRVLLGGSILITMARSGGATPVPSTGPSAVPTPTPVPTSSPTTGPSTPPETPPPALVGP